MVEKSYCGRRQVRMEQACQGMLAREEVEQRLGRLSACNDRLRHAAILCASSHAVLPQYRM